MIAPPIMRRVAALPMKYPNATPLRGVDWEIFIPSTCAVAQGYKRMGANAPQPIAVAHGYKRISANAPFIFHRVLLVSHKNPHNNTVSLQVLSTMTQIFEATSCCWFF